MVDRSSVVGAIYNNPVAVKFIKADGSTRVMVCTLSPSLVPSTESSRLRQVDPNQDYLRVWDLQKNEWRTFRFSSLQEYKILSKVDAGVTA